MKAGPWRFYLEYYRGSGLALVAAAGLSVLQSLLVLPIAYLVRRIFDRALPDRDAGLLLAASGAIVVIFLAEAGLMLGARSLSLRTTKRAIRNILDDIVARVYAFSRTHYAGANRSGWQTEIVQGTLRLDIMSNALIVQFLPAAVASLGLSAVLITLDARLFLFLLIPTVGLFIGHRWNGGRLRKKIRAYHQVFETFSTRILTILNILDLTHARDMEAEETEAQRALHEELQRKSQDQAWFNAFYQTVQRTMLVSGGAIILIVGGRGVLSGRMTVGSLLSFFAGAGLLRNSLLTLTGAIPQILEGREALDPLLQFFDMETTKTYGGRGRGYQLADFDGAIDLQKVHFCHAERPLLRGVSLSIRPGEIVGLTGPNGSGKSTIGHLILGFYAPQVGSVCAGGLPYEELDLRHLRRFIGFVPQEPLLFPGTIAENISYGDRSSGRESMVRAAEWASCRDFIERLPQGYDTRFEDPCSSLSGGELQKISIARAMAGRPRFLLLDEPTNHLDSASIARFKRHLRILNPRPAILLISQDSSILEEADRVLELCDGRISEVRASAGNAATISIKVVKGGKKDGPEEGVSEPEEP